MRRTFETVKPFTHIRWDRLARFALLTVFVGLIALYIGPVKSWMASYDQLQQRKKEVAALKAQQQGLEERKQYLRSLTGIEQEARKMGMAKTGEQTYVVQGLKRR